MHPEHYTDLDNLDTVENNLRHSAKGSNDAYDVTHSLTTTSLGLPPSPDNSGYVRSFLRLATERASPSCRSAPGRAVPARVRADTRVVSMASCALPCSGSPSATTSSLRSSAMWWPQIQMTDHHVRSHTGLLAHTRGCTLKWEPPSAQEQLPLRKLHGGGQGCREDGHTGSCEWTKGGEGGHDGASKLGKAGGQKSLPWWERHERGRRERARLGPQQQSLLHWEGGHQHVLPEIQQTLCYKLLQTEKRLGPVFIFDGTSPRSRHSVPGSVGFNEASSVQLLCCSSLQERPMTARQFTSIFRNCL